MIIFLFYFVFMSKFLSNDWHMQVLKWYVYMYIWYLFNDPCLWPKFGSLTIDVSQVELRYFLNDLLDTAIEVKSKLSFSMFHQDTLFPATNRLIYTYHKISAILIKFTRSFVVMNLWRNYKLSALDESDERRLKSMWFKFNNQK